MSRTYRRTEKGFKKTYIQNPSFPYKRTDYKNISEFAIARKIWYLENSYKFDYYFWMKDPSWHTKMHCHRPSRKRNRITLDEIKKGCKDADDTVYYDHKKPHIYYW